MQLHELKSKTILKTKKRVGRGGKRGKTSGRGTKGQKARAGHKIRPESRDIIKRIPKLRGHTKSGSLTSRAGKSYTVNLSALEKVCKDGEKINPAFLQRKKMMRVRKGVFPQVKILASGEITKKITIADCLVSGTTREKIEKAGGKVL